MPSLKDDHSANQSVSHLWQLLCNVSSNKHGLQVDPEVLHNQPFFDDLGGVGQLLHPELDLLLERSIVSTYK